LRKKLKKDKIYIEGVSWGTTISALMVREKPGLFEAYIGIGQVSDGPQSEILSYNFALDQALKSDDSAAVSSLQKIGSPPYSTVEAGNEAVQIQRRIVSRYMPDNTSYSMMSILKLIFFYEGWSFRYKFNYFKSMGYGPAAPLLWPEAAKTNLFEEMTEWPIPVYILQGDTDHFTETSLAISWFDSINAPYKKMKIFENTGHVVFFERPVEYREFYISEVLHQ
jgi:pimeloyl-ACP methyl ester carboxylesterase